MRGAMLGVSIVFIGSFLVLTIHAALDRGFTILIVLSVLIVGLMAIGIIGAIWNGFYDDE